MLMAVAASQWTPGIELAGADLWSYPHDHDSFTPTLVSYYHVIDF